MTFVQESFLPTKVTREQQERLTTVYAKFGELANELVSLVPQEDSYRCYLGINKLHEARFWFVEAICKDGE